MEPMPEPGPTRGVLNLPEGSIRAIITLSVVWTYLGLLTLKAFGPTFSVEAPAVPTEFNSLVMMVVGAYFAVRPPISAPEHPPRRGDPPAPDPTTIPPVGG